MKFVYECCLCILSATASVWLCGCANQEKPNAHTSKAPSQAWAASGVVCNSAPLSKAALRVSLVNVNQNTASNSYTQNSSTVYVTSGCSQSGASPTTTVSTSSSSGTGNGNSSSNVVTLSPVNQAGPTTAPAISGLQVSPNSIQVPVNPSSAGCNSAAQSAAIIFRPI